mgnify:CR=1 FL=1
MKSIFIFFWIVQYIRLFFNEISNNVAFIFKFIVNPFKILEKSLLNIYIGFFLHVQKKNFF